MSYLRELAIRITMRLHIVAYLVSRRACALHRALVSGRSDVAVERMERERGLS
ncbi:MAG: hypothetical protein WCL29_05985 [Pseudomonadota bacterium]